MPKTESPHARSARRAGWLLLAAAVMACSASRIDPSRLTRTIASADHGRLRLEYSRFGQAGSPLRLRLWVAPELGAGRGLSVRLSERYTRSMRIDRVVPAPLRVETAGRDVVFVFGPPVSRAPALIEFELKALDYGRRDGRLAVLPAPPLEFTQYLVP